MESRWRNWVILDYVPDFPSANQLELYLYSVGADLFPALVLGDAQTWGFHVEAGVLEVDEQEYDGALDRFAVRSFELDFVEQLSARLQDVAARTADARVRLVSEPNIDTIQEAVDSLSSLMAFHVLNWAVPFAELATAFGTALGDASLGKACLMRLLVPHAPAHLYDFYESVVLASGETGSRPGLASDYQALVESIGHLQAPGMASRSLEDPIEMRRYIESLPANERTAYNRMRQDQLQSRMELDELLFALHLGSPTDDRSQASLRASVIMCRLAADEEELRRRLQGKTLGAVRHACSLMGVEIATIRPTHIKSARASERSATGLSIGAERERAFLC
jgi:hypothetical protein